MLDRAEPVDAVDGQRRGADAVDPGAHRREHLGTGRRSPARGRRCRGRVVPSASTAAISRFSVAPTHGKSSQRVAPRSRSRHLGDDEAVLDARRRAEVAQPAMCMSRPREPIASPPGSATLGPTAPGDQRPEHRDRGAQPTDQVVRRLVAKLLRHVDDHRATSGPRSGPGRPGARSGGRSPAAPAVGPSRRRRGCPGRCVITLVPGASSAAAISFSALFFAPPTCTEPDSGCDSGPADVTRKPPRGGTLGHVASLPTRGEDGRRARLRSGPWSTSPASTPAPATPARPASAT